MMWLESISINSQIISLTKFTFSIPENRRFETMFSMTEWMGNDSYVKFFANNTMGATTLLWPQLRFCPCGSVGTCDWSYLNEVDWMQNESMYACLWLVIFNSEFFLRKHKKKDIHIFYHFSTMRRTRSWNLSAWETRTWAVIQYKDAVLPV